MRRRHKWTSVVFAIFFIVVVFMLLISNEGEVFPWKPVQITNHFILIAPNSSWNASAIGEIRGIQYEKLTLTDKLSEVPLPALTYSSIVRRNLNETQREDLFRLLRSVQQLFTEMNAVWCVHYGSLLGAFLTHDILPWDDDMDILVQQEAVKRLPELQKSGILAKTYGLQHIYVHKMHKIFFKGGKVIGKYPWSWPFLDIMPFVQSNGLLKSIDRSRPHRFQVPESLVFPLQLRPFGVLWVPAPQNPWGLLSATYAHFRAFKCQENEWNHVGENTRHSIQSAPCQDLQDDYPFVWRQQLSNITMETVWFDKNPLYTFVYYRRSIPCEKCNPFTWVFDRDYHRFNMKH